MQKKTTESETTLCAWCGEIIKDRAFLHNGEWICLKCKHGYIGEQFRIHKMWEGVINGAMAEGS